MTEQFVTKDSGSRRDFPTGARRDMGHGKGRYDLLPWDMIQRDAELLERGAAKYGDRNWQKGMPLKVFLDSAARHLSQLIRGDRTEDHAAAIRWNVAGFEWTRNEINNGRLPAGLADGSTASLATLNESQSMTADPQRAGFGASCVQTPGSRQTVTVVADRASNASDVAAAFRMAAHSDDLAQRPDENAKQHRDRVNSPWPDRSAEIAELEDKVGTGTKGCPDGRCAQDVEQPHTVQERRLHARRTGSVTELMVLNPKRFDFPGGRRKTDTSETQYPRA